MVGDPPRWSGAMAFLLHRAGDGGWSGLAGNPLLGAGQFLMQAPFAVICGAAHIPVTELARALIRGRPRRRGLYISPTSGKRR